MGTTRIKGCGVCAGRGYVTERQGNDMVQVKCVHCAGTGNVEK